MTVRRVMPETIRIKVFELGNSHNPIENTDELYIELEIRESDA